MFVSLQVGRGLAALAVAAFHLSIATGTPAFGGNGTPVLWDWFSRGNLGVDFFFVLSGFIILQAHQQDLDQPSHLKRYAVRRATRIFPIYWVYVSACIAGMAVVGSQHLELNSAADWLAVYSLVRVTDVALPLAQAWTLFHEVVFYTAFALFIWNRRIGLLVFGVWLAALLGWFYYPPNATQSFADTVLGAYNLNFFIGMLAQRLAQHAKAWQGVALLLGGTALFAATWAWNTVQGTLPVVKLAYALAFGAMVAGAAALERLGRLVLPAALGFIGDASYSIYLLHIHVQNYALRALMKVGVTAAEHPLTVFWLVMAITVLASGLAYQWLERPLLAWLRRRFETPTTRQASASRQAGRSLRG
jgi:peptidoglycan/LPS O-acetylase OafA/YrhL